MKFAILFGIIGILSFIIIGYMHEQVHVDIYSDYGIKSKTFYLSSFPDFKTVAEAPCPTEACTLAHNNNEIALYNTSGFYIMIFTGLFIMIAMWERAIL